MDAQIQEINRTHNYLNAKRPSLRHVVLKLSKVNDKRRRRRRGGGGGGEEGEEESIIKAVIGKKRQ